MPDPTRLGQIREQRTQEVGQSSPHLPYAQAWQEASARHFSPLAVLVLAWERCSPEERLRFLVDTLTPADYRALLHGWTDATKEYNDGTTD